MSTVTLSRVSGLTLLLGTALWIIGSILSFTAAPVTPLWQVMTGVYISGMALLLLGLPGIVARQATCAGWLGYVGFLLTFLGWFLFTGFYVVDDLILSPWLDALAPHVYAQWFSDPAVGVAVHVGNLLVGAGTALLGMATIRARVFSRWPGVLLSAAAIAAFGSFVYGNLTSAAEGLVALGLAWMGYELWTAYGEADAVPQPALF